MLNKEKKYIDIGIPFSYWEKEIEVVCPKCQSTALVHKINTDEAQCSCSSCAMREKKSLEQPKYFLSHRRTGQMEVDPFFNYKLALIEYTPKGNIWVYNADQLKHLKSYITAKLREKKETDKYFSYYVSYFHKLPAWVKSSKYRNVILKRISILEKKSITKPNNKTPLDIAKEIKESFYYRWNWGNRWKFLNQLSFLENDYGIIYYPNIKEKNVTIREIKNDKLSIFKAPIKDRSISIEHDFIEEISLKNTTKHVTFRNTREGKPTRYYLIKVRSLNNESFRAKELLIDIPNINIDSSILLSNDLIKFEKGDYMFMFIESNSADPDFAPNLEHKTDISYGFNESAIKKILKLIDYGV